MSKCKWVPLKHSELHHIYQCLGDGKKAKQIKEKLKVAMNTTCVKTERSKDHASAIANKGIV